MATTTQNVESPNTLLSTQTLRVLDVLCEGPISGFIQKSGTYGSDPLCATYYDDVPVRNPDGSYNFNVSGEGFSFDYMLGTVTQTGIPYFQKIENILPLSSNTRIANPPQGGGPYKTVVTSFTTNTFPDADSIKVTVKVPSLFAQDENANTNLYEIDWAIDIAVNGGGFTEVSTDKISGKCTQPYLKTVTLKLPKPGGGDFYEWKVRVRRVSPNILLIKTQNEIYVESISIVSTTSFCYPNTAAVGTEISADQFSSIPARSYELAGMLVKAPVGYTATQYPVTGGIVPAVYPEIWDGTFATNVWTDNPAWVFYDIMTNPVHGLGDYITPEYVDKWTLYDIARYCDALVSDENGGQEPQFTCNVQIQQPEEAYSVLLNLASTFRGMLYYANGTIHTVQTKDTPPVFSFTNANVVNGVFNYADSARNTRAAVAVVKWIDPDNGYRESVEYVEDVEGILKYGYNEKQMTAFACTSRGQAYRLGKWTLETERLQTETVTFQTDLEGTYLRPGDNFAIYDNFRNNRSQGGRITAFQTGRSVVTIDRPVEIATGPTYTLTALIPQLALMGTGDVTGSNQIDLIRSSQTETYQVITSPTSSTSTLTVQGQFNSGLFVGSPFILSVSGSTGYFDKASFYTCLATAEIEAGKIEILGLKASTGVYFRVLTGTPVIDYVYPPYDWPPNIGDQTAIAPPSNLFITGMTGALPDNTMYTNLKLTWTDSPGPNLQAYVVSGKAWDEGYSTHSTTSNGTQGFTWSWAKTGQYLFSVGAQNNAGKLSSFITGGYFVEYLNPFDVMTPLSGVTISQDFDPLYVDANGKYTGYIGLTPTFEWNVTGDTNGNKVPDADFIDGYRFSLRDFADSVDYITPVELDGLNTTSYKLPEGTIAGFAGGPQRGFKVKVDIRDVDHLYYPGGYLNVSNPPMKPPFASGFIGYNGGISYNVTPSVQYDTSGIYLWCDQNPGYTPTFSNYDYTSSNLAAFANIAPNTGSFYTWFALSDTWGAAGNPIYGPISGNADQMFGQTFHDVSNEINYAFGLLTGEITDIQNQITGLSGNLTYWVQGLSGSFTGQISGMVSQAMSVQLQQVFAASGFATSTQVNAVYASVRTVSGEVSTTGATLLTAIAATGRASSEYTEFVAVRSTGVGSSVQTLAGAYLTGLPGGEQVAMARWGFELKAGTTKVKSLVATSTSFADIGDLVLGEMNIKSDSYAAGSAGWQIGYNGKAEFSDVIVRGTFTGGSASSNYASIDGRGIIVGGAGTNDRVEIPVAGTNSRWIDIYNAGNNLVTRLGPANIAGSMHGSLQLYNNLGTTLGVQLYGYGRAVFNGDTSIGDGTNGWLYLVNDTSQIKWGSSSDVNLYRGGANQLKTDDSLVVIGDVDAASFNTTSSRRFKDNIHPLTGALDMIYDLQGVTFDWNTKDLKNDIGFIAEDVYDVLPTIVGRNEDGTVNGLEYGKLTVLSVEAIKELDRRLQALENRGK